MCSSDEWRKKKDLFQFFQIVDKNRWKTVGEKKKKTIQQKIEEENRFKKLQEKINK